VNFDGISCYLLLPYPPTGSISTVSLHYSLVPFSCSPPTEPMQPRLCTRPGDSSLRPPLARPNWHPVPRGFCRPVNTARRPRYSIPNAPLPRPPFSSCTPVGTLTRLSKAAHALAHANPRRAPSVRLRVAHHPRLSVALTHPGLYNTGRWKARATADANGARMQTTTTESAIMYASRRTHRRTDSRFRERSNRVRKSRGARWTRPSYRTRAHAAGAGCPTQVALRVLCARSILPTDGRTSGFAGRKSRGMARQDGTQRGECMHPEQYRAARLDRAGSPPASNPRMPT
ncbi:hypothetical protein C8R43DRAFT_1153872, partial [Mycena crocata]